MKIFWKIFWKIFPTSLCGGGLFWIWLSAATPAWAGIIDLIKDEIAAGERTSMNIYNGDDDDIDIFDADSSEALVRVDQSQYPNFIDDENLDGLITAIDNQLKYFNDGSFQPWAMFNLGPDFYEVAWLVRSLGTLKKIAIQAKIAGPEYLDKQIKKNFLVYKSVGKPEYENRVLFTGYYEVKKPGSLTKTDKYRYPLYMLPPADIAKDYSREQITFEGALDEMDLEMVWLENIVDAYFIHVQGSASLTLDNGSVLRVNYAGQNGHQFRFISKYMVAHGMIEQSKVSMLAIKKYLNEHPDDVRPVLSYDESFVYFRQVDQGPVGCIGVQLVSGRAIATDYRIFPKGTIAFIKTNRPVISDQDEVIDQKPFGRIVLDQDTGGAIKGAGRVDFYFGNDHYAEVAAGYQKQYGDLYYIIEKEEPGDEE